MCLRVADANVVYVIVPYFNFCNFQQREKLFLEFIKRYQCTPGIRLVVAEAGRSLPHLCVFKHLRFTFKNVMWVKEHLINLAVNFLPNDWKYVAWVDADITFLNHDWARETVEGLKTTDVLQLFHTAVNLGPDGESLKIDKGFGYMHSKSGTSYTPTDKYGFWHPGYAWAMRRSAWDKTGGLIDWAILGSGDRHMALALIGKVEASAPGTIHPNYKAMLLEYQLECKGLKLGCITGTILHHWHGSLQNRRYKERWDILTKKSYNPFEDIEFVRGRIQFTDAGKRLEEDIRNYFFERQEDS
jgi:hypothetical protein